MPIIIISFLLTALCVCFAVLYFKKNREKINLAKRGINITIFILSLISLIISLKLFWSMAVYVDDYGSSPDLITGGSFWLTMDWFRQGLLFILCVISGLKLIK